MWVFGWVLGGSPNPVAGFQLLFVVGTTWLLDVRTPPHRLLYSPRRRARVSPRHPESLLEMSWTPKTGRRWVKAAALEPCLGTGGCSWWGRSQLRAGLSPSSILVSPPHQPERRGPFALIPGMGAGVGEGCTPCVHAWQGWMGLSPSQGCLPLHQSRITTRTAPALAVNEITATAWSLCRRQRSGHDPVSI